MNTPKPNTCGKCGKPILEGSPRGLCALCLMSAVSKSEGPPPGEVPTLELDDLRRTFPQLEILELVGSGGMGRVYKVRQPNLDRIVALKLLPPAYAADPEWIERFTREARALARLNHPNIVQVYDFGETLPGENGERFPFLLMEYVDGVNLRQALRSGALTAREALTIVPSVCAALQYAHDQGVLHRDIKPENILLDTLGRVKIADFGLAKLHGESAPGLTLTGTGAQLGTAAYMAPEQIEKPHDVDHRADIYSLGVVFYELLTGELPLGRFPAPSEKAGTDPRLDTIVFRTLEKERDRRFQSATDMRTEVENVASHPASEPSPGTKPVAPPGSLTVERENQPRLSKMAATGAGLVGLGIPFIIASLVALGIILPRTWSAHDNVGVRSSWAITMIPIFVSLLGLLPAIAGTICGWIAIGRIRESAGQLRGAGIATFAALFYPSCLLIGLCAALFGIFISDAATFAGILFGLGLAVWIARKILRSLDGQRRDSNAAPVRWPWIVGLLAIACLMLLPFAGLLLPYFTLHASRESIVTADEAITADVVTADRPPFVGVLSQGTVELRGVAHYPGGAGGWWRMDGSPVPAPATDLKSDPDQTPKAGERAFTFVLETKDLPTGTTLLNFEVPKSKGWSFRNNIRPIDDTRMGGPVAMTARLPANLLSVDFRAGFEVGEWTTIFETSSQSIGSATPKHEGTRWKLGWSNAIETKDGLIVSHWSAPRVPEWGSRVVLIKKDGKIVFTNDHTTGQDESEWRFSGVPLAEVATIGFQVRRVQWIQFRKVALKPLAGASAFLEKAGPSTEEQQIADARKHLEFVGRDVGNPLAIAFARRALAIAEARGNAAKIAEANAAYARERVAHARLRKERGMPAEYDLDEAQRELAEAERIAKDAAAKDGAPATVDVLFPADPARPMSQSLVLDAHTPFGHATDFSWRVRDARGERELTDYSAIVAWERPEGFTTDDGYDVRGAWEFSPGEKSVAEFAVTMQVSHSGPTVGGPHGFCNANAFQSRSYVAGLAWAPHPDRPAPSKLRLPARIPFLTAPSADGTAAEVFLVITSRPLLPGETAPNLYVASTLDRAAGLSKKNEPRANGSPAQP